MPFTIPAKTSTKVVEVTDALGDHYYVANWGETILVHATNNIFQVNTPQVSGPGQFIEIKLIEGPHPVYVSPYDYLDNESDAYILNQIGQSVIIRGGENASYNWVVSSHDVGSSTVIVKATMDTSLSGISSGVKTIVGFNTKSIDTNSNFDTDTYAFTAPRTGYYQVMADVKVQIPSTALTGASEYIRILQNDTAVSEKTYTMVGSGTSQSPIFSVNEPILLAVGDVLQIAIQFGMSSGTASILKTGSTLSIVEIPQTIKI